VSERWPQIRYIEVMTEDKNGNRLAGLASRRPGGNNSGPASSGVEAPGSAAHRLAAAALRQFGQRLALQTGCGQDLRAHAVPALMWPGWALHPNPGFDSLPCRQGAESLHAPPEKSRRARRVVSALATQMIVARVPTARSSVATRSLRSISAAGLRRPRAPGGGMSVLIAPSPPGTRSA
jgi:hypothetical protein